SSCLRLSAVCASAANKLALGRYCCDDDDDDETQNCCYREQPCLWETRLVFSYDCLPWCCLLGYCFHGYGLPWCGIIKVLSVRPAWLPNCVSGSGGRSGVAKGQPADTSPKQQLGPE